MTWRNEVNQTSMGGTELMMEKLISELGEDVLKTFQIIPSRVRELDENKIRVLWCHDLPQDPESHHLKNGGWRNFHKIVFCSHWQQQRYLEEYGIPWDRTCVMKNAIDPIDVDLDKKFNTEKDSIRFVYHTTPHRGLALLVPVFDKLCEQYTNIHLDVFSSFKIYGWDKRDEQFQELFDQIENHEKMTYHGFVPNQEIKEHLKNADVFAYPNIWPETSCISLMEAMSAGCLCIHPNYAALYETASNWTFMYNYIEDYNKHANFFYNMMEQSIHVLNEKSDSLKIKLKGQKSYADLYYNWEVRKNEWSDLLKSLEHLPRPIEKDTTEEMFTYKVG